MNYDRRDMLRLMASLPVFMTACGDSSITSPSPVEYDVPDDIEPAPEAYNATEPDFYQIVGVSAFALPLRDASYQHAYINRAQEYGYNTLRVPSETGGWWDNNVDWLPPGPPIGSKEAKDNLKRVLRVAAQYSNLWVEVVAGFTYRDDHKATIKWARTVANICKPHKNVFISAMNEPQMSNWTNGELNELMAILRSSGRPVGVDQPVEAGYWKFPRDLVVDFRAMHPWRNARPGVHTLTLPELRNVIALNGLTLFDETNCYVSDWEADTWRLRNNGLFYLNGNGTERQRQEAAVEDMEMYRQVRNARWFFHSIATIRCDTLDFYLPRWR